LHQQGEPKKARPAFLRVSQVAINLSHAKAEGAKKIQPSFRNRANTLRLIGSAGEYPLRDKRPVVVARFKLLFATCD
jgi:hypothetical protein